MLVTELNIYPLKSARGIALKESAVSAEGLPGDRRAMLTDPSGHFITQRELPAIATVLARHEDGGMALSRERSGEIFARPSGQRMDVAVWKSIVSANIADDETNDTLSAWLGREVKLVFFDDAAKRIASLEWTGNETPVTFADGYQILVTTTAFACRTQRQHARKWRRRRGHGAVPAEYRAGDGRGLGGGPLGCHRDRRHSFRSRQTLRPLHHDHAGPDDRLPRRALPMKAMGRIRMSGDRRVPGPLFGWNVTPRGEGRLSVGDVARVVEERPEGWAIKRR